MKVENAVYPDEQQIAGFFEAGHQRPIYMVNLLKFKPKAEYEDGRDHLAHATSVAETTPDHTQHTARNFFLWGCCRALPLPVAGSIFFSCIPGSNS